jgi:lipopolysaccharide exporter
MGYTKDAVKGISWLGFFRVASRGVSYIRIAILARLLTPLQFGLADVALIVLGVTEIFTETGVNLFLIQQKEKIDKYIDTAWVVSIIRGGLISLLIVLSAQIVSIFFQNPEIYNFLIFTALIPVVRGFINPSVVLLVKELDFRKEFYFRTSIFIVEVVVGVYLAFVLRSSIAIIAGILAGAIFESIVSFMIVKPTPAFKYNYDIFREILKSGKWFTMTGIFSYLYHNGDNIAVGRILGTAPLGLYQRVYSISILPITEVSDVILKVTYAVFAKISSDVARLRRAYLKSIVSVCVIVIPVGSVFFFFPEQTIRIILGEQWIEAAPALKVLAVFGVLRAISLSSVAPFYALKRQELVTRITFVAFLGLLVTIVPFVTYWGIVGAAYSALIGVFLSVPLTVYYLFKILK